MSTVSDESDKEYRTRIDTVKTATIGSSTAMASSPLLLLSENKDEQKQLIVK